MEKYKLYHFDGLCLKKNAVRGPNFSFNSLEAVYDWIKEYKKMSIKRVSRKQFVIVKSVKYNSRIIKVIDVDSKIF